MDGFDMLDNIGLLIFQENQDGRQTFMQEQPAPKCGIYYSQTKFHLDPFTCQQTLFFLFPRIKHAVISSISQTAAAIASQAPVPTHFANPNLAASQYTQNLDYQAQALPALTTQCQFQIQKTYFIKDYMNGNTNFTANWHTLAPQSDNIPSDLSLPPINPIKGNPNESQSSIFSHLSPFGFPPRIQARPNDFLFCPFPQMREVQTPLPKEKSKFIGDVDQEGIDYTIVNRIIFESAREDGQFNSSEAESQDENEDNDSQDSHDEDEEEILEEEERESSEEEPENEESGPDGESKGRRPSKQRVNNVSNSNSDNTPGKKIQCNCKKTKCLKLYCDCFRLNQTCDGCNCVGCHNLDIYEDQRNSAIMALMDRNPDPFGQKIQADKHVKGCNCKKSNCLKKYCQCYQAGLKCGQNCKCEQCKNLNIQKGPDSEKQLARSTAKKERRMLEI